MLCMTAPEPASAEHSVRHSLTYSHPQRWDGPFRTTLLWKLAHDFLCCIEQSRGDDVWTRDQITWRPVLALDQRRVRSQCDPKLQVGELVTDDPATGVVNRLAERLFDLFGHCRPRLATLAVVVRQVRTDGNSVDGRWERGKTLSHPVVQSPDVFQRVVSSGNAGLICDQRNRVPGIAKSLHGFRSPVGELPFVDPMHEAVVDVQSAVAVKENYLSRHDRRWYRENRINSSAYTWDN